MQAAAEASKATIIMTEGTKIVKPEESIMEEASVKKRRKWRMKFTEEELWQTRQVLRQDARRKTRKKDSIDIPACYMLKKNHEDEETKVEEERLKIDC